MRRATTYAVAGAASTPVDARLKAHQRRFQSLNEMVWVVTIGVSRRSPYAIVFMSQNIALLRSPPKISANGWGICQVISKYYTSIVGICIR